MDITPIQFPNDKVDYLAPSWSDLDELAFLVSQQIIKKKFQFDRIVTLAKGGWPMSRSLVDYLGINEVASIGVKFYAGINQHLRHPHVYQNIPVSVAGEKVLLFDDVTDTGESLKFAIDYLKIQGVRDVTTASLFYKPHSSYKPDFYGMETTSWIVFPYDAVQEAVGVLARNWQKQSLTATEINKRLKRLGINTKVIQKYL